MLLFDDLGIVHLYPGAISGPGEFFTVLSSRIHFLQNSIRLYGKTHAIPRLEAWFGDQPYRYSGHTIEPQPWFPELMDLRQQAEDLSGFGFNSCLVNYYRDGSDYCAWHADDEKVLGPSPAIASLSLGGARRFLLRQKKNLEVRREIVLGDGDVLIMSGELQKFWEHSLAKTSKLVGPRINVTFRKII